MRLIFYKPAVTNSKGEQLATILQRLASPERIDTCETIDSLSRTARQRAGELTLAVLMASDQGDLQDLVSLKDLLSDFRVIVMVPDRKSETISAGHLLQARFMGFPDDNISDMAAVLERTIQLMVKEESWC